MVQSASRGSRRAECGYHDGVHSPRRSDQEHPFGSIESGILFNRQSGLEGIAGVSADMRQVFAASAQGNSRARLAVDGFVHRIPTLVGSMVASLGARCFGVHRWNRGNSPEIRAAVLLQLCVFGSKAEAR